MFIPTSLAQYRGISKIWVRGCACCELALVQGTLQNLDCGLWTGLWTGPWTGLFSLKRALFVLLLGLKDEEKLRDCWGVPSSWHNTLVYPAPCKGSIEPAVSSGLSLPFSSHSRPATPDVGTPSLVRTLPNCSFSTNPHLGYQNFIP